VVSIGAVAPSVCAAVGPGVEFGVDDVGMGVSPVGALGVGVWATGDGVSRGFVGFTATEAKENKL
jgi:hypothetical protein